MTQFGQRMTALLALWVLVFATGPVLAFDFEASSQEEPHFVLAADSLVLEDNQGYSTEYIFGMTKGVMNSTLEPALKPAVLLVTVPLDIVFLPFAAIGGFFR
ncbi:MAG: hypothetical protein VX252_13075 [Myxococcota bacterium]|nr:hypothetical protein [Myxococcota bacterium]